MTNAAYGPPAHRSIDNKWNVKNGQHRLNACILAKKPFKCVIVQGVPPGVYKKLDSGEKRRAADWLAGDEENAKVLAAALRILWTWEQGSICSSKQMPSNAEIAGVLDSHPGIRKFNNSTFAKSVKGMPGSLVMALRYIFGQHDQKLAEEFFEKLKTGEGLKRDNPILVLRDKLANKEKGRSQLVIAAVTIKAWNAFVEGVPIAPHDLRFRTGKSAEKVPAIAGVDSAVAPKWIETQDSGNVCEFFSSDNRKLSEQTAASSEALC